MGIRALIGRNYNCPGCEYGSFTVFSEKELLMNGKNHTCPACGNTLWIPKNPERKIEIFKKSRIKKEVRRCPVFLHVV